MSDDRIDEDPIMDLWYSNWEQQCIEAIEAEPDYERQMHAEKERLSQQLWTDFQTTASSIAQLYKGNSAAGENRGATPESLPCCPTSILCSPQRPTKCTMYPCID